MRAVLGADDAADAGAGADEALLANEGERLFGNALADIEEEGEVADGGQDVAGSVVARFNRRAQGRRQLLGEVAAPCAVKRKGGLLEGVLFHAKDYMKEMSKGLHVEDNAELTLEEIHDLAKGFAERQNIDKVMVTMSAKGIAFYDRQNDTFQHQPAFQRRVSDVSGAGDTVISVSTLFLLKGHSVEETCLAANLAGGIVCEYVGVVPINCAQLKAEMAKYAPGR